jgi:hypothetical protein
MGLTQSPKIITDGLVFAYDMGNGKSLRGAPVTNTLPSPELNGFPTYGNGWGTYNTNQYNGGNYFSIGTISSVTSNIVTTSAAHPLRSYDVVMPQTTGGGVTAGTSYVVKKLSSTTFSLHPYNGSQDGSQGYINPTTGNFKVYDDWANDVRVSINSSSFPTMWWGYPHMPNSALVKEIIPGGFNGISGAPSTDCIRLHFHRTDATDGMAYAVDAAVTAGNVWTASFWARAVSPNSAGVAGNNFQIYNYGGANSPTNPSMSWTLGPVGVWQRHSLTWTANNPLAISYWFPAIGGCKFDISNIQYELGSTPSNFAPGTRTNSQAILDMTRKSTMTASNLVYNSNNTFNFSYLGPSYITVPLSTAFNKTEGTMNFWVYPTRYNGGNGYFVNREDSTANAGDWFWIGPYSNTFYFRIGNGSACCDQDLAFSNVDTTIPINTWTNMCFTWKSNGTSVIYKNGVELVSRSIGNIPNTNPAANGRIGLGHGNADDYFNGIMPSVQIYNRQLTASEVNANFNATRGRYGI